MYCLMNLAVMIENSVTRILSPIFSANAMMLAVSSAKDQNFLDSNYFSITIPIEGAVSAVAWNIFTN